MFIVFCFLSSADMVRFKRWHKLFDLLGHRPPCSGTDMSHPLLPLTVVCCLSLCPFHTCYDHMLTWMLTYWSKNLYALCTCSPELFLAVCSRALPPLFNISKFVPSPTRVVRLLYILVLPMLLERLSILTNLIKSLIPLSPNACKQTPEQGASFCRMLKWGFRDQWIRGRLWGKRSF